MSDPLAAYLHGHLAGSKLATELPKDLHDQHASERWASSPRLYSLTWRKSTKYYSGLLIGWALNPLP